MIKNTGGAGGTIYLEPIDDGWINGHSFADLDGYI